MKLLSILIPTYNRASYLKDAIMCLLPQFSRYKDELEILVSDNCSSDDTKIVIDTLQSQFQNQIIYYKQSENIGFEANFEFLINKSKGKYLYLMGDDDILAENFFDTILPLLRTPNDYTSIHWNRLTGNKLCSNNKLYDPIFTGKMIEELDATNFVKRVMDRPNFISSIVFKKEIIKKAWNHYKDEYEGYKFCGPLYWGIVQAGGLNIYHYMPLIIQRVNSSTWAKLFPYYLIGSMSNIFLDLDVVVPGIYLRWQKKLKTQKTDVLYRVADYRSFYRQQRVKSQMFKHMNCWDKIRYYYYLIPGTNLPYFLGALSFKLKKIINKVWR